MWIITDLILITTGDKKMQEFRCVLKNLRGDVIDSRLQKGESAEQVLKELQRGYSPVRWDISHISLRCKKTEQENKRIKTEATKKEFRRVFENMNTPCNICATCSDGRWVRYYWRNPSGEFGWDKWKKLD